MDSQIWCASKEILLERFFKRNMTWLKNKREKLNLPLSYKPKFLGTALQHVTTEQSYFYTFLAFMNGTWCLGLATAASFATEHTVKETFGSQVKNKTAQNYSGSETSVLKVGSFVVGADTLQQELLLLEERRGFILPGLAVQGFYGNQIYVKEIRESFPQN